MFDFETNSVVKDITTVPEQFRPLFAEDPAEKGTFKIKAEDPALKGAVEALIGSARALKAERKLSTDAKAKAVDLTELADFGKSPAEIKVAIQAKIDELQGQLADKSKARLDLEKVKADHAAASTREKAGLEAKLVSLKKQLETVLVDNSIRSAADGQVVDMDLIMPHIKDRVKAIEEEGQINVYVVDETGAQRHSPATGSKMTINELVKELKGSSKFAPLFKSDQKSGSGAAAGASAAKVYTPQGGNSVDKISRGLNARNR